MKRYVMIVVSPARPTPTARAAAACPSSCVDPARESRRRACSVPRTPTARHRTCQPPLGGGVTSSAAIDAGRGGVSETGALRWDFSPIPFGNLGDLDFIASPNVFTANIGATPTPLVGVGSKNGVYYTVDRDTGAPVWQQAVVSGGISGGVSPSTGVAFGKVYAATFTGPPYIFALDAERRRRVAVSANGMQCVQLRARWNCGRCVLRGGDAPVTTPGADVSARAPTGRRAFPNRPARRAAPRQAPLARRLHQGRTP